MTDPGAGHGFDLATTHPRAKPELDVLAAPDAHSLVERSDLRKVVAVDGDCAADQCWRRERQTSVDSCLLLVVLDTDPRVPNVTIFHPVAPRKHGQWTQWYAQV